MNLLDGLIYFGIGIVPHMRKHEPQIERGFAAFGRDLEHVVVARIDFAALDLFRPFDELIDESFQLRRGRRADGDGPPLLKFRHRQLEHFRRLDIGNLAELLHQLRHVHKARKAALQPVAAAVRAEFHRADNLAESACP